MAEIPCSYYQDLLPMYAARRLAGADIALVERHLSGCGACRGVLAEWRAIGHALSTADARVPPSGSCPAW
jgi:hypothetical protein